MNTFLTLGSRLSIRFYGDGGQHAKIALEVKFVLYGLELGDDIDPELSLPSPSSLLQCIPLSTQQTLGEALSDLILARFLCFRGTIPVLPGEWIRGIKLGD